MGFIINKSYARDSVSTDTFYARIQQYSVERFPGTAYAMIQYFKSKESAAGYTMQHARTTYEHELEDVKPENFPIEIDANAIIGGDAFVMPEPLVDSFRIATYGFWFPLGDKVNVIEEFHEMQDSFVEMPYVDFDEDGNPVQAIKQVPCKKRVLVNAKAVEKHVINIMTPEFMLNPYAFLYTRLKTELEKIFGKGNVIDDL